MALVDCCEILRNAVDKCDIRIESKDGKYNLSIPRITKAYLFSDESYTVITTDDFLLIKFCPFCGARK